MSKLYLICGKGGVGKTTVASAIAVSLSNKGQKTLLLSTDFSPAVGDVLDFQIGHKITKINENLFSIEIDQKSITDRWIKKFGQDFNEILSRLINIESLDKEAKHNLLEYISSAPSLKEETMLDYIVELCQQGEFERVVWDSAPAGETLNLLNMPLLLKKHLTSGAKIYESIDKLTKFAKNKRTVSEIIDSWVNLSVYISNFIKNNASFIVVTNPEKVVYQRTKDILNTLREYEMNIKGGVINKIFKNIGDENIKNEQLKIIHDLYKLFDTPLVEIEFNIKNVRSIENLKDIGSKIIEKLSLN